MAYGDGWLAFASVLALNGRIVDPQTNPPIHPIGGQRQGPATEAAQRQRTLHPNILGFLC